MLSTTFSGNIWGSVRRICWYWGFTTKFVVSRCTFCKLRRDFGFFCSVNHLNRGGVNANHNIWTRSQKRNWEWRRKSRWWVDFLSKEGGRHCFILASDKIKKDQKNLLSKLADYSPTQDDHKSSNTVNKPNGSKSTNHKPWPFKLVHVNMFFLRGPLRWLTEEENPKTPSKFAKRATTNLAVSINGQKERRTPVSLLKVDFLCRVIFPCVRT